MRFWKNLSITKKLYTVVGFMAVLIAGELVILRFSLDILSSVRAFVEGESTWSKAQKNAAFHLQRYGLTRKEAEYEKYLESLKIPEGDSRARLELLKPSPDMNVVREGFLAGHIHPDDIDSMVNLLQRFYWVSYIKDAIHQWTEGDRLLGEFKVVAEEYRHLIRTRSTDIDRVSRVLGKLRELNEQLTVIEERFSSVLGSGSRWLEGLIISLLFGAVILVESIGLTLAFLTARSISRGLAELNQAAQSIGEGNFSTKISVHSRDEIGLLTESIVRMRDLLQKSYANLETRVKERTRNLAAMAEENAKLYKETMEAVQARDEFLSIASHELRTPLTSLHIQLQMLARNQTKQAIGKGNVDETLTHGLELAERQSRKLGRLIDELLDVTRISAGRLTLQRSNFDLAALVRDTAERAALESQWNKVPITVEAKHPVTGHWDPLRIEQVISNLLSNAIKYGQGKPITIKVGRVEGRASWALLSVEDNGAGVPADFREKIFERFERANLDSRIGGLGLGLYITRQIVLAHGGEIRIDTSYTQGARFLVELPDVGV